MTKEKVRQGGRAARILLIEDNPGDVILTRQALDDAKIVNELVVAMTGEQGLAMLNRQNEYGAFILPDLILLDLNLPGIHGHEVFSSIKDNPILKNIPVIILSSSRADLDIVSSFKSHANGYLTKPLSVESLDAILTKLEQFWFTIVVMPESKDVN